ncbi:MAG: molybdopterin converting factor subunit 1 [Gammaproteobacteria bacterium]
MTITVKFFASLSEQLGKRESSLALSDGMTIEQVWFESTNQTEMPAKLLMAINMEYAKPDTLVKDNDEVAFFPPVTGG